MKIHPVFHILALQPTKNSENVEAQDEEFEVGRILGQGVRHGITQYRIRWQDMTPVTTHGNLPEILTAPKNLKHPSKG